MWRFSGLLLLILLLGCKDATQLPSPFHASNVTQNQSIDFSLIDQAGKTRSAKEFQGKVSVVFFGYTNCPEICPTTLADMTLMLKKLGADAAGVQVLFVTLDPARDTVPQLRGYMDSFDPSIVALTGSEKEIRALSKQFGVTYSQQPLENGYFVDHTTNVFLLDLAGKLRLSAPHGQKVEWLVDDVRLLLKGV